MKQAFYGFNGRGATPEVREIYSSLCDRTLERSGRDLGVFISETPMLDGREDSIARYRQLLEAVWIAPNEDLAPFYTLGEKALSAVSLVWQPWHDMVEESADRRAMQRAKEAHKKRMAKGLAEIVSAYRKLVENCSSKIAEVSRERDTAYERAHASESLAMKEVEYAGAFEEKTGQIKEDMKKLDSGNERRKVCDCERIVYDLQLNIEASRRKARHYAKQNELHAKKTAECAERIGYLRFLKGRYLAIVTQADIMLSQISSNEFNIENCLAEAGQIDMHNSLMGEAESVMVRQEDAQETSIDYALSNFGFADEYSGSETWKEAVERAREQEEKETDEELKSMHARRRKRLEELLAS